MPFDLTGRALYPLSDLIAAADFPLAEYLPSGQISAVFDRLSYTDATVYHDGENVVFDVQLVWEGEFALSPPGTDAIALVIGSAGVGMTSVRTELVIGPDLSLELRELTFGLRVSPEILRDVATDAPAELSIAGDVHFSPDGISLSNFTGANLPPAYLCGTEIIVAAAEARPVFGSIDPPDFLGDQEDFQGLTFEKLSVSIPSECLELDPGQTLTLEMVNAALGTTGFTGQVSLDADPASPVTGTLLGFPFRFRHFRLDVEQNAILDASLGVDVRVKALEDGAAQKWIAVDLAFDAAGSIAGALAAVQPPEAEASDNALVTAEFEGVVRFDFVAVRLVRDTTGVWSFYFSGLLRLSVPGADWPDVAFDEIGVNSNGDLLVADGGGIAFATPLVVAWHFATLSITKFRFGRSEQSSDRLQIALAAEIVLLEGIPAGAAVEGLVIEWTPGSGQSPSVRFEGIGIAVGVPGSFRAALSISYVDEGGAVRFVGTGSLEIPALDMAIDVGVVVGRDETGSDPFTYLYLFADAKLLPTGIPIGSTSLVIYGFQGLIAYNMRLGVDANLPADQRYFALFAADPVGITAATKWQPSRGQHAIGAGIVIGTTDKGYAVNVKGMLVVAFPDITILLHARANFLKKRPKLESSEQGALDALLVYSAGASTISIDILARWEMPSIVSVTGQARAFFSFTDSSAWYLEIGRDEEGKRVLAQALKWSGEWLFSAGFWFRLDPVGLVTGVQVDLHLRKSKGGFYVEVRGTGRAEMKLFWEPSQWEGSLELSGRISAGYRGISVGLSLTGNARARVRRPFDVHLRVKACVEALFWDVCKTFDFEWEQELPPVLELPLRRVGATPRHWTPLQVEGPPELVETGVVALETGIAVVQPHSIFSIDFAKPMVDATGAFNEAITLPDDGFLTIGEGSQWSAAFRLDRVEVFRDPDGARQSVDVWGTWARETLEPNTTLRLLTSERFGDDGSLTDGYADGHTLDYCAELEPTSRCVRLSGISPIHDRLDDGSLVALHRATSDTPTSPDGLILDPHDRFVIRCPRRVTDAHIVTRHDNGAAGRVDLVADPPGTFAMSGSRFPQQLLLRFCYATGHSAPDWPTLSEVGGVLTGVESWTVSPDRQIFQPDQLFELVISTTPVLQSPEGDRTQPLGTTVPSVRRFRTAGPPAYPTALEAYIADVYPGDGTRPVYCGYDIVVRLVERYVTFLYTSVGESLAIRLFDAQGRPVLDANGNALLVPIPEPGPEEQTPTKWVWSEILEANVREGCATPPAPPTPAHTILRVAAPALEPNSQYSAAIVSTARPEVPLAGWGFTTSRFGSFTDLVTQHREIAAPRVAGQEPGAADFDSLAREMAIETIAYTDHVTITPLLRPDGTACVALLIESPEPLEAGIRFSIDVNGSSSVLVPNVDGTRVILLPGAGATLPTGGFDLALRFRRKVSDAIPVLAVAGNSADEIVSFHVDTGGAS